VALAMREPVGVIGLLAPDDAPLLGAVSLMAPAIAMGNRVVLVPSWPAPLAATDLYQVLDTSDVPGGVVNIVTGDPAELGGRSRPSRRGCALVLLAAGRRGAIEKASAGNLKRTWINHGGNPDWMSTGGRGRRFLDAATEVKTIWVPYGE
jgi:aldehyde dehydrogenase (NAD+)